MRKETLAFEVSTECACCRQPIRFKIHDDLSYTLHEPPARPLFFVPMVDLTRLRAPSIIDAF